MNEALEGLYKREVPYSKAPALKGSNFEDLKKLAVLDAKTHDFADAWRAGFTGAGVTVGVLDGGTDFGHPDLIGTWQVWSSAPDPGWNGWPKAFDPYGTLQWLAAPSNITDGLSWYTLTQAKTCALSGHGSKKQCSVVFATRTGPSRNFNAPAGTVEHTYTFPAGWTKSGTVRLGSHPDDHLLALFEERPAFLVADPNTAGRYDTVYVDLDGDLDFSDEKPVTKASPASYRDMNGDGYTDLSGGLLYYISDGATSVPGGVHVFGGIPGSGSRGRAARLVRRLRPGDRRPRDADRVEHRRPGRDQRQGAVLLGPRGSPRTPLDWAPCRCSLGHTGKHDDERGGTYPGAVIGGAPHAKLAPYGDIYFSFDFSTQFGYFLATRSGVDITSNSYGSSDVDNDGYDAASQEADVIHNNRHVDADCSRRATARRASARPHRRRRPPGISVGASTQFGGTGWDSIDRISQVVDNEVMVWSNRGPGATGTAGRRRRRRRRLLGRRHHAEHDPERHRRLAHVGRHEPLDAGRGGRDRARLPGVEAGPRPDAAAGLLQDGEGHPQVVVARPRLRLDDPGRRLGRRRRRGRGRARPAGHASRRTSGGSGDYRGTEYPVFTHVDRAGRLGQQTFTIDGPGTWQVSDRIMTRTDSESLSFSSKPLANESPYNFNAPDYLMDLTGMVEEHKNADLMVVRLNYPRAQFDGNGDYDDDQDWRLLTYSWTDIDRDGRLWRDRDGDGVVDKTS